MRNSAFIRLVVALSLLTVACARRTAGVPAVQTPASSQKVFMTQAGKATLAGEGDAETRLLRQRIAADPAALDLRLELARRYELKGFADLALEHVRLAREKAPLRVDFAIEEARLLIRLGLAEQAASTLGKFASGEDAPAAIWSWLGIARDEAGDPAGGELAHRRALELAPADAALENNLGYNLLQQRKYGEAKQHLESAIRIDRGNDLARANLARTLALMPEGADSTGAVAHWTVASGPAAAHSNLAAAMIEKGDLEGARKEAAAALRIDRNYTPAWNNLGLIAAKDGKPVEVPAGWARSPESRGGWARFRAWWNGVFSSSGEIGPEARASR